MEKNYIKAKYTDVTGENYNGVTAFIYLFSDKFSHDYWVFRCPYCKNFFVARLDLVKSGKTKSCGCLKNKQFREHVLRTPTVKMVKRFDALKQSYCTGIIDEIDAKHEQNIYKVALNNIRQNGMIDASDKEQQLLDLIRMYALSLHEKEQPCA